jgi:hypothetical protein
MLFLVADVCFVVAVYACVMQGGGYWVTFPEYGNSALVTLGEIQLLDTKVEYCLLLPDCSSNIYSVMRTSHLICLIHYAYPLRCR